MKKLIIIPAYNEQESIKKTVEDIMEKAHFLRGKKLRLQEMKNSLSKQRMSFWLLVPNH